MIEVIIGSMFAGKTDALISRAESVTYADRTYQAFKPETDTRSPTVRTHRGQEIPAHIVPHSPDILTLALPATHLIAIDEGQLFDDALPATVTELSRRHARVLIAGLPLDYRGHPFGPMPHILALATHITQLYATCPLCGEKATRSQRLTSSTSTVLIGAHDKYEARCLEHFKP